MMKNSELTSAFARTPASCGLGRLVVLLVACFTISASTGCNNADPSKVQAKQGTPAESQNGQDNSKLAGLPTAGGQNTNESSVAGNAQSDSRAGSGDSQPAAADQRTSLRPGETLGGETLRGATRLADEEVPQQGAASAQLNPAESLAQLSNKLQSFDSNVPEDFVAQLQRIDGAIQDLMSASANNVIDENEFRRNGLALGKIKLATAQRLAGLDGANAQQQKAGQLAQLVALSHLSGFRDVDSAKELERYAQQLSTSSDLDLAHQSRVVLMGFQLQALQNGLVDEPSELLAQAEELFQRPEDRNFPELMILLQSTQVLEQMGFDEAAGRVQEILVTEFSQSSDPQLRSEAWNFQTRGSQALENYLIAFRNLGTQNFDSASAMAAARGLLTEFPGSQTLEQLAGTVTNIEYGGNVELARQLVDLIEQGSQSMGDASGVQASEFQASVLEEIQNILSGHKARMALLGKPLPLEDFVRFDGQAMKAEDLKGKVVLVDFWATWCVPCLREIPKIREVYASLHDQGFEVLSVNMDDDLIETAAFLEQQKFPWATYRSADEQALGFKSSFARRMGISAIPFMILLDQQGHVASIHVRGEKLMPSVRELLGLPTSLIPKD